MLSDCGCLCAQVLVDAPCSSSGVLRRHPGLRWGGAWAEAEAAAWDGAKGVWLEGTCAGGVAKQAPPAGAVTQRATTPRAATRRAATRRAPATRRAAARRAAARPGFRCQRCRGHCCDRRQASCAPGRLVYATCSLDPAENAAVAAAFERGEQGAAFAPWPFAADVAGREPVRPHQRTLWPHRHDTDGFFVARWRRRAS